MVLFRFGDLVSNRGFQKVRESIYSGLINFAYMLGKQKIYKNVCLVIGLSHTIVT